MPQGLGDGGDIFIPESDTKVAHLAEVTALRQLTDTVNRMGRFMQNVGEKMDATTEKVSDMHTQIALLTQQNEQVKELKTVVTELVQRIAKIELLHAEQHGAAKFITAMKDFGPWLVSILIALWAFFEKSSS